MKEVVDPRWGFSPRWALQRLGTEGIRNSIGDGVWIRAAKLRVERLFERNKQHSNVLAGQLEGVVISDVRFPNEADAIREWGGQVWRVVRPGMPLVEAHVSETAMDDYVVDHVIPNDGTLEDLKR